MRHSPYLQFSRAEWGRLRADTPLTLAESDLALLRGENENISLDEVVDIYLPLSRLLNLYVGATQGLYEITGQFLANAAAKVPYMIGLGGSVAVGKSTTSRILQALLSRGPGHPRVALVATDGFLFPNRVLEARGLMHRKGFPESYDLPALLQFVAEVKSGSPQVSLPVYSHHIYDIVPGKRETMQTPDIMIVEGLNVLQSAPPEPGKHPAVFLSDYFDFTIYVDAETKVVEQWYLKRFATFRERARDDPSSYFSRFSAMSEQDAAENARTIWRKINEVNLNQNILPTRERSRLILEKSPDHSVRCVRLRKL